MMFAFFMREKKNLEIRLERNEDIQGIVELTKKAFEKVEYASHTAHFIVNTLIKRQQLILSLVAGDHSVQEKFSLVGHVAVSSVKLSNADTDWYGLGPVSVMPKAQNRGAGKALMRKTLSELKLKGACGCVLLGDPNIINNLVSHHSQTWFLPMSLLSIFRRSVLHNVILNKRLFVLKCLKLLNNLRC